MGCVVLDNAGDLAAGTSTGGMTNKRYGRVGDAPIIGAGTYCNNETAGISCTGWGEFYICNVVAKTISDLMEYKGLGVAEASKIVLDKVGKMGGDDGLIALDKKGTLPCHLIPKVCTGVPLQLMVKLKFRSINNETPAYFHFCCLLFAVSLPLICPNQGYTQGHAVYYLWRYPL